MPSINYMQQSAPFWDFIANLEREGQNHPYFSQSNQNNENAERGEQGPPPHPFAPWGWGGWGGRAFPHRGPPGPPPYEKPTGDKEKDVDMHDEKDTENEKGNVEGPSGFGNEGSGSRRRCGGGRRGHCGEKSEGSDTEGCGRHGRCGGRCHGRHSKGEGESGSDTEGWGSHHRWGGRGRHHGPHGGPPGHHGPHGHHSRGGFGGRGRGWGGPWGWGGRGGPFGGTPWNPMSFAAGLFNPEPTKDESEDFTPEADIFDTETAYVIHVSLPGAKKEDVGVNWDAEKSELSIAGVVYRPGDEEFLKTLAMNERKTGPFERKVRLGTRATPAQIDVEGISAKLEDGVLRVEVPKLETGFVEVLKVDIE